MYRHLVIAAAALALAVPAALAAQTQTDRDRERAERARERAEALAERARERQERDAAGALDTVVTFDARGSVSVSCPGGAIVVTAADRPEVRVHARTERGAIRFTSTGSHATLEPADGRVCRDARFEVVVPTGSHVSANSWSGTISVRGVAGDIEAHAMSGDIEVRDAGGRVDVESLSGDVTVHGVKGEASLQTVSGSVTLDGARGAVEVESVSGDAELRDVSSREVRAHTTSGDITFAGLIADAGRYEFETHSGAVLLRLPSAVGAQLSLSTYNGSIDSDFPITLKAGQPGAGSSNRRMDFSLGQGTARIIAETFSGDITLTSSARRP